MKKSLIFLMIVMLISLTACVGKDDVKEETASQVVEENPEETGHGGYYVMESAVEDGVDISPEELEEYGMDAYLILKEDGIFASAFTDGFGEDIDCGTWEEGLLNFEDEKGQIAETIPYKLKRDKLTIDWGQGFIVTYVKSNDSPPEVDMPVKLSDFQELWDGDWYGYWIAKNPTESYINYAEAAWLDCFAKIKMNADDTGTLYLWDPSVDLATVEISISQEADTGPMGIAVSKSGTYWNDTLIASGDWVIDPSLSEHENYMVFDAPFKNVVGEGFDYEIHLIPWGEPWDDFPEDKRPPWFVTMSSVYSMDSMLEALESHDRGRVHSDLVSEASEDEDGLEAIGDVSGERISTGLISALCPTGWKNYDVLDKPLESDDIDPRRLEFHKGAEDDVDRYRTPSVEIYYLEPDSDYIDPNPINFVASSEEWGPMEFSGRNWQGFIDADTGDVYIWAQEGDQHLRAEIYIKGDDIEISMDDEDVQAILSSIGVL